jgi:peroxiredoxin
VSGTRWQWVAVGAIVGVLALALIAGLSLTSEIREVGVGTEAPPFEAVDVRTGDTLGLDAFAGRVVLLNVWATWCGPCEAEMPSMQRLHERLGSEGLAIVAVSVDVGARAAVRRWIEERELTFSILQDPAGTIERTYQTIAVPESFVIDRNGTIVKKHIGALEWDAPEQQRLFRQLLGLDDAEIRTDAP